MTGASRAFSLRRRIAFGLITVGVVVIVAFAIAEIALRVLPIPGLRFHTFYYDDLTGGRFYPNTTFIYRNARGDHVRRSINSWGYMDREHDVDKPASTMRIGFFGDSFTEARQVPIEEAFHQLIEKDLRASGADVECIAISMGGYGTLQSYLEYTRWADSLQLDWTVYVFCENDPGDHIPSVKRADTMPYPYLIGDSLVIDFSFRDIHRAKTRPLHRAWQYLKSNSLVFSTLEGRLRLLQQRGVQVRVDDAQMRMAERADENAPLSPGSLPSTWPDSLLHEAMRLCEKVILTWRDDAVRSGRQFCVVYIPRQGEMAKPPAEQDSFAAWLAAVCARHEIVLIDPSSVFVARLAHGQEIYYDHLSRDGHRALADVFLQQLDKGDY